MLHFGFADFDAYNPASQILTRAVSNNLYEWVPPEAATETYTPNGLNQYTSVGGVTFTHDLRGNTTYDGTKTYAYDSFNRLISSGNGASASYDPTGRLFSYLAVEW